MGNEKLSQNKKVKSQQPAPQIHVNSREVVTSQQLSNLLGVAGFTASFLGHVYAPDADGNKPPMREAHIAAENTFINALSAIDNIVNEASRWSMETQKFAEDAYKKAIVLNEEFLVAQKRAAEEITKPHSKAHPSLIRMQDGAWLAILGHLEDIDNSIMGVGNNAQEALDEFDESFCGRVGPNTLAWIKKHGGLIEHEYKQLDGGGDSETSNPQSGGEDVAPDSGSPGAQ
jgi:hypothetical protein